MDTDYRRSIVYMINKNDLRLNILLLMMIFVSWQNFQIGGVYFFIIFELLYCIISFFCKNKKILLSTSKIINWCFILLIISAICGYLSNLPDTYKSYSITMTIILLPTYFFYTYLLDDLKKKKITLDKIVEALKTGFLIQICYLPFQFFMYHIWEIDLNDVIFVKLLHLMNNASFIRQGTYYPSGFTWHSALLAPMLVLSFVLFQSSVVRGIIIMDSFICGNNTALLGVAFIMFVLACKSIKDNKISRNRVIAISVAVITAMLAFNQIIKKVTYIIYRIIYANLDSSSRAHLSYYTLYPDIIKKSNIINVLFGTGYATSGHAITQMNGQYMSLAHWAVESDLIDILISRGMIGFLIYFGLLLYIAFKGKNINYKYFIVILAFCIQGITYNVQFEYVFMIELVMYSAVVLNQDLFKKRRKCYE